MKIALLGYGKMGRMIEEIALSRGHEIVLKIDRDNTADLTSENLQRADAAIEFSTPDTVLSNIDACFTAKIPVVVGTTGWYGQLQEIKNRCEDGNQSLIYGSNFSVGVNVLFRVNAYLARLMNRYPYYDVQVEEIHHTQKLDAPSGTAMTIAEGIIDNLSEKTEWVNVVAGKTPDSAPAPAKEQLLIESLRIDKVPGTHTVIYDSEVDTIELKHTAHSRQGFALGAVMAAEWIKDRRGFFAVTEMFDFAP
ncbi:MAG: 4-hydroxy-tetrahydrodipicolinate reductase [Mucilaginibacter polytrichastri]|nr:4-hydroxy-tetrahydrodipicolinate reductase [Mucilaginibacter polytrichastri]